MAPLIFGHGRVGAWGGTTSVASVAVRNRRIADPDFHRSVGSALAATFTVTNENVNRSRIAAPSDPQRERHRRRRPHRLRDPRRRTVSDPAYAAVNGDDLLPDLALGRLPAATLDEARVLIDKIVAFEASGQGLSGPAVLVADNPDSAGDFEADADDLAAERPRRPADREAVPVPERRYDPGRRSPGDQRGRLS